MFEPEPDLKWGRKKGKEFLPLREGQVFFLDFTLFPRLYQNYWIQEVDQIGVVGEAKLVFHSHFIKGETTLRSHKSNGAFFIPLK